MDDFDAWLRERSARLDEVGELSRDLLADDDRAARGECDLRGYFEYLRALDRARDEFAGEKKAPPERGEGRRGSSLDARE